MFWLLRVKEKVQSGDYYGHFYGSYASSQGHIVRSDFEKNARILCAGVDEPWWLYPHLTTCEPIDIEGNDEIIMSDLPTG